MFKANWWHMVRLFIKVLCLEKSQILELFAIDFS